MKFKVSICALALVWFGLVIFSTERAQTKRNYDSYEQTYPDFVNMDKKGEEIDCAVLLGSTSNINRYYKFENYLVDSNHEYSQCNSEISQYVENFCLESTEAVFDELLHDVEQHTFVTTAHLKLCGDAVTQRLRAYESTFHISPTGNRYIDFPDDGLVVRPEFIEKITYWSTDYIYGLELHFLDQRSVTLSFGDEEKFSNAKMQFVDLVSSRTALSL